MDSAVTGTPRLLLRLEGLAVLSASVIGYHAFGGAWPLFALLFLSPDLSLLGYLAGPRVGAASYNALHSYVGPACLTALMCLGLPSGAHSLTLIWTAHIGLDRCIGLGLKYPSAFRDTHLGVVGRAGSRA